MGYGDSLLANGERVVLRVRQHWFVMLWGARFAAVALAVAVLLLVVRGNLARDVLEGPLGSLVGWIVAGLFIYGLLHFGWASLQYINQEYVLTNRRVLQVSGVINKRSVDSSLEKINDAVLSQSIVGRVFGFGDLDVLTASEQAVERFRMIVRPVVFKKAMLDAKHDYEIDVFRSSSLPTPPVRATGSVAMPPPPRPSASVASAPAPSATTGAAARAEEPTTAPTWMRPDEVTRTLASLADLRDRGAISAEEYAAKKADLLARL